MQIKNKAWWVEFIKSSIKTREVLGATDKPEYARLCKQLKSVQEGHGMAFAVVVERLK